MVGKTSWTPPRARETLGRAALGAMADAGQITIPADGDLTARMLLAALDEAGLAVGSSADPPAERERALALFDQLLSGLRPSTSG